MSRPISRRQVAAGVALAPLAAQLAGSGLQSPEADQSSGPLRASAASSELESWLSKKAPPRLLHIDDEARLEAAAKTGKFPK